MSEFRSKRKDATRQFILRLDLDFKPLTLRPFIDLVEELGIKLTVFVRVAGPYNIFWYPNYEILRRAASVGCEIGLHTTPVEWGELMGVDCEKVFQSELSSLRSKFDVVGVAPHRDINYMYNSLPWMEQEWQNLKNKYSLEYHAYEEHFFDGYTYVNEGFRPIFAGGRASLKKQSEAEKISICYYIHIGGI